MCGGGVAWCIGVIVLVCVRVYVCVWGSFGIGGCSGMEEFN